MNFTLLIRSWWVHKYALYTQLAPLPPSLASGLCIQLISTARFGTVGFYTRWQVLVREGQIGQILTLVHGFYTRRTSFCACWQVLMLVGKFLRLLASSYTISGFRWYDAPQDEALSRFWPALSSRHPMGSKPLFQEMPHPLGLTYHITMCCNVGILYSNVMDCQETPHWLLFYPKSRNLSKCNLTS